MTAKSLIRAGAVALALCLPLAHAAAEVFVEGDLARQAALGFAASGADGRLVVGEISQDSPAYAAGLREGDAILAVNGETYTRDYQGAALLEKLKAGREATLRVSRGGAAATLSFTPAPRPYEEIPGLDSYYGVVETSDGARLRTIITKPEGTEEPLPAIFFTQWVSCGSLEYNPASTARNILAIVAQKSGMALIRVERSASGDSEGPACHELDYDTELQHYFEAYDELMQSPHIDAGNVVIQGSSLGSTTAPLLARRVIEAGHSVRGVAVQGGGAVTYLERMINFDRNYLERRPGVDPDDIHRKMIDRIRFHYEYLINGRDPDEIANDSAAMTRVRGDILGLGDGQQYGRPYAWHRQAAKHNFLAAWRAIEAPVLVVFNGYDQYEMRHGHRMIADFVNRWRPGSATYVEQESIGHSNTVYPTVEDAYAGENGVAAPELIANRIVNWLKTVVVPTFE